MMRKIDVWIDFLKHNESVYSHIIDNHFLMCIVDTNYTIQYVRDFDSGIPIPFEVGQVLPSNSTSSLSIQEKQTISRIIPKDIYGVEMRTISVPFEDGTGCVSVIFNIKTAYEINTSLEGIIAFTQQISASSQNALTQAIEMERNFNQVITNVQETVSTTKSLHEIYHMITKIAENLRLISINALIQAAHAGEHGRSFSVVAGEVRKLAEQTRIQIEEVSEVIKQINLHSSKIEDDVIQFSGYIKEQNIANKEISGAISSVAESTQLLQSITNKLLKL